MPELTDKHEQLWLELLADNELSRDQRCHLFDFLDRFDREHHRQHHVANEVEWESAWKRCAMTLLHERLLGKELTLAFSGSQNKVDRRAPAVVSTDLAPAKQSDGTSGRSLTAHKSIWTLALASCLMFILGGLTVSSIQRQPPNVESDVSYVTETVNGEQRSREELPDNKNQIQNVSFDFEPKVHTIYEVENTPSRATYYLNEAMPDLLLQALVLAGHSVKVEQDFVMVEGADGENVSMPVSTLQIEKFASRTF